MSVSSGSTSSGVGSSDLAVGGRGSGAASSGSPAPLEISHASYAAAAGGSSPPTLGDRPPMHPSSTTSNARTRTKPHLTIMTGEGKASSTRTSQHASPMLGGTTACGIPAADINKEIKVPGLGPNDLSELNVQILGDGDHC